jgi:hypothetical protein
MLDCRHCGEYLTGEPERYGSRCPRCREPLYERPDGVRRQRDAQESQGGTCAVHPGNPAVGTCKRCGTFVCGLCRSRWNERTLCVACIDRMMTGAAGDDTGQEQAAHRRQALLGVILGLTGWVLALPLLVARGFSSTRELMLALLLIALMSLIPTLFGVGQAAAAIRVRGNRMIMATCGLALSGLQVGTVLGLVLLVIWKH